MKALIVTSDYPLQPDRVGGGVEGVCHYLVQTLRRDAGLEVEVLLANPRLTGEASTGTVNVGGVRVHRVGTRPGWPRFWSMLFGVPRATLRRLGELSADIVHVQALERVAARLRQPGVLTIHGINELDTRFRGHPLLRPLRAGAVGALARRARHRVPHVIAINPYVRQFLPNNGPQRVWDIPNPVLDSFFGVDRNPEPGRILAAARLIPLKNITGLLEGFARVAARRPGLQLRLAGGGGGPYEAECRRRAAQPDLAGKVHFLGQLDVPALQQELSRAACLALTSHRENAPLVISEAHAAGVPVVASRVCGIPFMIEEGVTGRLINPADPDDIARGLDQLLHQDDPVAAGQAARRQAERTCRAANVARRTVEVYEEVLRAA